MRLPRPVNHILMIAGILLVGVSFVGSGALMTQRAEEYVVFIASGRMVHHELVVQAHAVYDTTAWDNALETLRRHWRGLMKSWTHQVREPHDLKLDHHAVDIPTTFDGPR